MIGLAGKPRMLILHWQPWHRAIPVRRRGIIKESFSADYRGSVFTFSNCKFYNLKLDRMTSHMRRNRVLVVDTHQGARTPFENRPFLCHVTLFKAYVAHVGGDLGRQNRYSIYIHIHIIYISYTYHIYIGYICCSQLTCYSLRAWKIASGKISTF